MRDVIAHWSRPGCRFYFGCYEPAWLERTDVPLMLSYHRLKKRRRLPRAQGAWALDSGAYTHVAKYGTWRTSRPYYACEVRRYRDEMAAWTTPPFKTGRSELVLQVTGAAYVGFAVMNWMARDILIGGIYSRPLAMGNFVHFVVVAITLLKVLLDGHVRLDVVIAFSVFAVFAVWFGFVAFTHPIQQRPERTAAARSERADPVG